jgi:hypothetical protein
VELLPELNDEVAEGFNHVLGLTNEHLKQVLRYIFFHPAKGMSTMAMTALQDAIHESCPTAATDSPSAVAVV